MPRVQIPQGFRPALITIGAMSDAEVGDLVSALSAATPTLNIKALVGHVQAALRKELPDLEEVLHALTSMNNARVGADISTAEFAHEVASQFALRKDKPQGGETLERKLVSLLDVEVLVASAKAFDVQHEYEKLFIAARILTDTRSVFNQTGTEVVGAMIVHNLNVKYSQDGQFREIFIALDDSDLVKLRRVLERAEVKAATLQKLIDKTGVRYFDSK